MAINEQALATLIDERIRTALDNRAIGSQTENVHKDLRLNVVEKAVDSLRKDLGEQVSLARQELAALRSDQIDMRTTLTNLAIKIETQNGHFATQLEATKNLQTRLTVVGAILSIVITIVSVIAAVSDIL